MFVVLIQPLTAKKRVNVKCIIGISPFLTSFPDLLCVVYVLRPCSLALVADLQSRTPLSCFHLPLAFLTACGLTAHLLFYYFFTSFLLIFYGYFSAAQRHRLPCTGR